MILDVCFLDTTHRGLLGLAWRLGADMFKLAHKGGIVVECTTPEVVLDFLGAVLAAGDKIRHAQFIGHGSPGSQVIGGKHLDAERKEWRALAGGLVWFRSCYVMKGLAGHRYAFLLGAHNIDVVGSLTIVGTWGCHSYLVGLRAGEIPWWDPALAPKRSEPWLPRTIVAWQMTLPRWIWNTGL